LAASFGQGEPAGGAVGDPQSSSRCRAGGLGGVGSRPGRCRSGLTAGDFGCIGAHARVPAPGALPVRGGSM
jgi:hypothetical protein